MVLKPHYHRPTVRLTLDMNCVPHAVNVHIIRVLFVRHECLLVLTTTSMH